MANETFDKFRKAVGDLATAAQSATNTMDPQAKKLVVAYNAYLQKQTADKAEIEYYETWMTNPANQTAAGLEGDEKAKETAAATAIAAMNGQTLITGAKASVFSTGKYVAEQSGSFFERIWEFIKNNKFTAGAAALGVVASNALGLSTIGTILLVVGGAVAGAVLGDKESGFIGSNIFGMKPKAPAGPDLSLKPVVAPGVPAPVNSLPNPEKKVEPFKDDKEVGALKVVDYSEFSPHGKLNDVTHQVTVIKDGREITYYGKKDKDGDKFVTMAVRIADEKDSKKTTPTLTVPEDAKLEFSQTNLTFPINKEGNLTVTKDQANKTLIALANAGIIRSTVVEEAKTESKPEIMTAKVEEKKSTALPTDKEISIVITKGDKPEITMSGKVVEKSGKKVFVVSNAAQADGTGKLRAIKPQTPPMEFALDAEGKIDLEPAVEVVKKARTAELAVETKAPDRVVQVTKITVLNPAPAAPGINFSGEVETNKDSVYSDTQKITINGGRIDGTKYIIPEKATIQVGNANVVMVGKQIEIDLSGMDIEALKRGEVLQSAELAKRLSANTDFTNEVKKNDKPGFGPVVNKPQGRDRFGIHPT